MYPPVGRWGGLHTSRWNRVEVNVIVFEMGWWLFVNLHTATNVLVWCSIWVTLISTRPSWIVLELYSRVFGPLKPSLDLAICYQLQSRGFEDILHSWPNNSGVIFLVVGQSSKMSEGQAILPGKRKDTCELTIKLTINIVIQPKPKPLTKPIPFLGRAIMCRLVLSRFYILSFPVICTRLPWAHHPQIAVLEIALPKISSPKIASPKIVPVANRVQGFDHWVVEAWWYGWYGKEDNATRRIYRKKTRDETHKKDCCGISRSVGLARS